MWPHAPDLHRWLRHAIAQDVDTPSHPLQDRYDDAMFDFSTGDYDTAIHKLEAILAEDPKYFDAQLSLGMAYYRNGDFPRAIAEGHKAQKLRPHEQLVHTNLSLFYMKSGDKTTAEHHGLQARIASWKGNMDQPQPTEAADPELRMAGAGTPAAPVKLPTAFPEMPWKKKTPPPPPTSSPSQPE